MLAAEEWVWVPDDADQLKTRDYHMVAYPQWFTCHTQVACCRSARSADDLIVEVAAQVRRRNRNRVAWWLSDASQPADLESRLRALGADHRETVDVLAFDMTNGLPDIGDVEGVRCGGGRRAHVAGKHVRLGEVFGEEPTDGAVAKELAELSRPIGERDAFRIVAYIDDQPAARGVYAGQ